jgi:hypothetical protein
MLFDKGDAKCQDTFIETCAKLNVVCNELDMMHSVVADDFNCQSGSIFYNVFIQYCGQMTLICSFQISKD